MVSSVKRIIIDPRCRINYASYYIEGLRSLFGSNLIKFECLKDIKGMIGNGIAAIIISNNKEKRVFFDYIDADSIDEEMYIWADAYGKVNLSSTDVHRDKIVPMGPNFGVSLWNPISTIIRCLKNYSVIRYDGCNSDNLSLISFLRDYAYMFIRRKRYNYYHRYTDEEQRGYVFSLSTLWWGGGMFITTNKYRSDFIHLCKQHMDEFEGGFFYVNCAEKESKEYSKYKTEFHDIIYKHRMSMSDYDKRSRKSWFVFSTPSVNRCHGWKLGEYLCEGKAIVSTPLTNVMPGHFEKGVHYLEVNSLQEMEEAIIRLRDDAELVERMKKNAFQYFNEWVSPEASVKHVLDKAGICY